MLGPRRNQDRAFRRLRTRDDAVSPVVATVLLVMLAAVLSAGAYAYLDSAPPQTTHPTASFRVGSCQPSGRVGVMLVATSTAIPYNTLRFVVTDPSSGATVGIGSSDLGANWPPGTNLQVRIEDTHLRPGQDYDLTVVYVPSETSLAALPFRCTD